MANSPILKGEPFSKEKTAEIAEQFFRDGFVYIPDVLTEWRGYCTTRQI